MDENECVETCPDGRYDANRNSPINSGIIQSKKQICQYKGGSFMKYILGLDVGIGSVGWAVISEKESNRRIEENEH